MAKKMFEAHTQSDIKRADAENFVGQKVRVSWKFAGTSDTVDAKVGGVQDYGGLQPSIVLHPLDSSRKQIHLPLRALTNLAEL